MNTNIKNDIISPYGRKWRHTSKSRHVTKTYFRQNGQKVLFGEYVEIGAPPKSRCFGILIFLLGRNRTQNLINGSSSNEVEQTDNQLYCPELFSQNLRYLSVLTTTEILMLEILGHCYILPQKKSKVGHAEYLKWPI